MLGVQAVTRPSVLVVAVKVVGCAEVLVGECKVRVTGMLAAGRPSVVSRTWHVMGGFWGVSVAMVGVGAVVAGGFGEGARCEVRAWMRVVALFGIR